MQSKFNQIPAVQKIPLKMSLSCDCMRWSSAPLYHIPIPFLALIISASVKRWEIKSTDMFVISSYVLAIFHQLGTMQLKRFTHLINLSWTPCQIYDLLKYQSLLKLSQTPLQKLLKPVNRHGSKSKVRPQYWSLT